MEKTQLSGGVLFRVRANHKNENLFFLKFLISEMIFSPRKRNNSSNNNSPTARMKTWVENKITQCLIKKNAINIIRIIIELIFAVSLAVCVARRVIARVHIFFSSSGSFCCCRCSISARGNYMTSYCIIYQLLCFCRNIVGSSHNDVNIYRRIRQARSRLQWKRNENRWENETKNYKDNTKAEWRKAHNKKGEKEGIYTDTKYKIPRYAILFSFNNHAGE